MVAASHVNLGIAYHMAGNLDEAEDQATSLHWRRRRIFTLRGATWASSATCICRMPSALCENMKPTWPRYPMTMKSPSGLLMSTTG